MVLKAVLTVEEIHLNVIYKLTTLKVETFSYFLVITA